MIFKPRDKNNIYCSKRCSRKACRIRNLDKENENNKIWRSNNPDRVKIYKSVYTGKRRANIKNSEEHFIVEDIRQKLVDQKGMCAYCEIDIVDGYHVDHIVALAKGGSNGPNNIALSCGPCNIRKGVKSVEDFLAEPRMNHPI